MAFLTGKFRSSSLCWCTAFQLYPHFPLHLGGWGELHYVSPHTKKLPFSSRLSIHLKLWWPTHPYFSSVLKMGMISAQGNPFPFSLFSQYVLITYYLQYWQLWLYIFLNKQEITEIPHLFPQPWPRPGALDNECN